MRLIKSLALSFLTLIALKAHAIDQMYNWNGLEFVTSGNVTHVHPASPQSTVLRGGWTLDISDVEPKATATHPVPYKNKSNALVTVKPQIDPKKVSSRVAHGLKSAAIAGASSGNGYVAVGALACGLFDCGSALTALLDWGVDQVGLSSDGELTALVPDESTLPVTSDGYYWEQNGNPSNKFLDPEYGCRAVTPSGYYFAYGFYWDSKKDVYPCRYSSTPGGSSTAQLTSFKRVGLSNCPAGSVINNGVCNGPPVTTPVPMETYLQSNYTGKGWNHHWAKMTAEIVKNGGNVFTDGTSTSITGPAIVPVSTSETKTPVSLVPGTTTPAPSGHTGPTDSGTQTTTTTTTAKNTYSPAPLSPASSGGPATGPSMTTTQETKTTTSITNNVTNITNIVNETTTEKDEAPEENATDTPLVGIPELYKQKYPDGLTGVFNDFKNRINTTSFVQLIGALTPNISGAGTCPSWTIDLTWTPGGSMGTHTIGQDFCWIWPILKIIVIVTTLFTVRRLIFGG